MVTVTGFKIVETEEGDSYVRLLLNGDLEMVKSQTTGNMYATTRRCSISATFDEETANRMIGKELPGEIVKVDTEPYEYTLDSGETIEIAHRWVYEEPGSNLSIAAKAA